MKLIAILFISLTLFTTAAVVNAEETGLLETPKPGVEAGLKVKATVNLSEARLLKIRARLNKHLDRIENHYRKHLTRIEKNDRLDADTKAEITAYITGRIDGLAGFRVRIENADTMAEFKEIHKDVKKYQRETREHLRKLIKGAFQSDFDGAVNKAQTRLGELTTAVAEAKAAGKDVKNAEKLLVNAELHINLAIKLKDTNIKAAISNLKQAYHDFAKVKEILT